MLAQRTLSTLGCPEASVGGGECENLFPVANRSQLWLWDGGDGDRPRVVLTESGGKSQVLDCGFYRKTSTAGLPERLHALPLSLYLPRVTQKELLVLWWYEIVRRFVQLALATLAFVWDGRTPASQDNPKISFSCDLPHPPLTPHTRITFRYCPVSFSCQLDTA